SCGARFTARPRPTGTSAAPTKTSPGKRPTRQPPCASRWALPPRVQPGSRRASSHGRREAAGPAGRMPARRNFTGTKQQERMSTTPVQIACDVKSMELADMGKKRIDWANQFMKVLQIIRKEFIKNQPLKGVRISACLHVTAETANLMITLRDGGAEVALCASNPLSTQDDVAACLVRDYGIPVFAIKGEDNETYYQHIMAALDHKPNLTMDD